MPFASASLHLPGLLLAGLLLLSPTLAIPGKTEQLHNLDAAETEWSWLGRLSDRYKFNALAQRVLHNRLVINYMRSIPKAPGLISPENPVTLLVWNTQGFEELLADPNWTAGCPVPCRVTTDPAALASAHILMATGAHPPEAFSQPLKPYQQKALFVLEPDLSLPNVTARVGPFHMLTSYSRYSDVRIDYSRSLRLPKNARPNLQAKKGPEGHPRALAAAFFNNCGANGDALYREAYLKELSVHMDVDFYGGCLHTPGLPTNATLAEVADKYHFVLAFENTILDDYVTDKFYDALASDAIPVYMGAPNVAEFLPDPHNHKILVEARHYPDPANLAGFLKRLAADEEAYLEYFEWRQGAIDSQFSRHYDFELRGEGSFPCRMCTLYFDRMEK